MKKFLAGKKIYLRKLTSNDCDSQYLAFVNDREALSFVEGIGCKTLNKKDLLSYVNTCNNSPTDVLLGIFENRADIHVGNIHLSRINPIHKKCRYGIVLHRDYAGRGYAHEASNILIKYAFEKMDINRIEIDVVEKNKKAMKLYRKLGAVKEGRQREAFRFQNKYCDIITHALLKNDYFNGKS